MIRPKVSANASRQGALFVGRLSKEKGIETLIRAWKSLDLTLSILGDGPLLKWAYENSTNQICVLGEKRITASS